MTLTATLPVGLGDFSVIYAINDQDEVVGSYNNSKPAAWQNGLYIWPSFYAGDSTGGANGINGQGQIVGVSSNSSANHPVLWQGGTVQLVATTYGSASLYGINDAGVMVGSSRNSSNYDNAYMVNNGVATDLGALPGGDTTAGNILNSRAMAINDSNQIVGFSMTSFGVDHAALWQNGSVTDLGGIANNETSEALAINQSGLIVGFAANASGVDQAVTWLNGVMSVLAGPQSGGASVANAVNDEGLVVGSASVYTRSGWQNHAVVWQDGQMIDLNSLLPSNVDWLLNSATTINNNGEIAGMATFGGFATFAYTLSIGDASGPAVSASAALQAFAAAPHSPAWNVSDSSANIVANLDALGNMGQVAKLLQITFTDSTTPVLTLSDTQWSSDSDAIGVMAGGYDVQITDLSISYAEARFYSPHVTAVAITDTAADVESNLFTLESWAGSGKLLSVTVTDSDPVFTISATDLANAEQMLSLVQGAYQLDVIGATASQAEQLASDTHLSAITIDDTAANIVGASQVLDQLAVSVSYVVGDTAANIGTNIDALEALHDAGHSVVLGITDTGGTLSLTAAQLVKDYPILHVATGSFTLSIAASQANLTINGLSGHANVAVFQDSAADYVVAPVDGETGYFKVTDSGTGRVSTDTLYGVTALQFASGLDFVVAAPSAGGITTGNVTELYAAVLARLPDVAGVQFYQQYLASNPSTSSLTLAEWFLQSPEYKNNSAHAYAQSADGDASFITDTYQNLLHRAPDTGAVAFYQKVVAQFTDGLTSGTAAYAAAQLQGHAQVLVYFSASAEFLSDVQITAQHPADAQHWLYVI